MSTANQPILRTLELIREMNHRPHSTLAELHRDTGLPKPTLHRLLATLKAAGYVRADVAKGVYSLTSKVKELSEGFTEYELVVEVGRPILVDATRKYGVPLAIGILENERIKVRYSSMPYSPIASEHTTLGHTHELLNSGMGQAYLAFCSRAERNLLERQLISTCPNELSAREMLRAVNSSTAQTQKRGYGLRLPDTKSGTATLAVPITIPDRLLGVLSVTTFSRLMDRRSMHEYLEILRITSSEIASSVLCHQMNESFVP